MRSDAEINDKIEWNSILEKIKPTVQKAIRKTIFNICPDDIQSIEQDIIIKVYSRYGLYKAEKSLNDWVYIIAKNHCIDILRKKRREPMSSENVEFYSHKLPEPSTEKLVFNQVVDLLPIDYRPFIIDSYILGLKQKEIATKYQLPIGTVSGKIQKGILYLRKIVKKENLTIQDFYS